MRQVLLLTPFGREKCMMWLCLHHPFSMIELGFYLFNSHLRTCLFILEREEGREEEREIHWCERETSIGRLLFAPRPGIEPRYNVSWSGIEPTTFWCMVQRSTQLSHLARARAGILNSWSLCCNANLHRRYNFRVKDQRKDLHWSISGAVTHAKNKTKHYF